MGGFLSTRGSFMLDGVFIAMMAVIPLMGLSRYLVRNRKSYTAHKTIQLSLATILLLAVIGFEVEMRMFGWTDRAAASRFWVDGRLNDWIDYSLAIHLCFAIPTPFLWGYIIYRAWRGFPRPPHPSAHSASHRFWGRIGMGAMTMTALTGWCFYWLAFVA